MIALGMIDSSIVSATIAGIFLLANTLVTLYVTSRRSSTQQIEKDVTDDLERRRAQKSSSAEGRSGAGGDEPGSDHPHP